MGNMKRKPNGLLRLFIVLSILWALGISFYMWTEMLSAANKAADWALSSCMKKPDYNAGSDICTKAYSAALSETRQSWLKEDGWWAFPCFILIPPVLTLIFWYLCLGAVKTYYWIMVGFGKKRPGKVKKQTIILFLILIFSITGLIIYSNLRESSRAISFDKDKAECSLKTQTLKMNYDEEESYIATCLTAKGWQKKYDSPNCFGSYVTYSCY